MLSYNSLFLWNIFFKLLFYLNCRLIYFTILWWFFHTLIWDHKFDLLWYDNRDLFNCNKSSKAWSPLPISWLSRRGDKADRSLGIRTEAMVLLLRAQVSGLCPSCPATVRENHRADNCGRDGANPWTSRCSGFSLICDSLLFFSSSPILSTWLFDNHIKI